MLLYFKQLALSKPVFAYIVLKMHAYPESACS